MGDKSKRARPRQIHADTCCERCLYNIPPGSLMSILPGGMVLIIGIIVFILGILEDPHDSGLVQSGIIFMAMGGLIFLTGTIYCTVTICKYSEPRKAESLMHSSITSHAVQEKEPNPVELIGIYRIRMEDNAYVNRGYEYNETHASRLA